MSRLTTAKPLCRPTVLLAAALVAGCSGGVDPQDAMVRSFADLTGAKASESAELREAIGELEQMSALPRQVARPTIPDAENAAAALAKPFDEPLRISLNVPLERLVDRDRFRFDATDLDKIDQLVERHAERIKRVIEASKRPDARFAIAPGWGFFASTAYLDDAAIACRFDLVIAASLLSVGEVGEATAVLERAAKWIGWLSREPRLEPRLLAARLRGEWLRAVEAVAEHPSGSLGEYEVLRGVLVGWLDYWPDEAKAISGDRAATLHAYEALRAGLLVDLATEDELIRLKQRGVTPDEPVSAAAIDADELAYLTAVGKAIALVRRPYFERVDKHRNVAALLGAETGAPFAEELFLPGLPTALETCAIDRATCEVWALALSSAGGFRLPPHRLNPHSGEAYQIDRLSRSLVVKTNDPVMRDAFALVRGQ